MKKKILVTKNLLKETEQHLEIAGLETFEIRAGLDGGAVRAGQIIDLLWFAAEA